MEGNETEQKRRLVPLTEAGRNNAQCTAAGAGEGKTFESHRKVRGAVGGGGKQSCNVGVRMMTNGRQGETKGED
jgi:hypothetical protein